MKLLLEAGAKQRLCDLAGWTEKEHAFFKGHMKVAELLAAYGASDHRARKSSEILRTGTERPGDPLKSTLQSQTKTSSRLEPSEIASNYNRMQRDSS